MHIMRTMGISTLRLPSAYLAPFWCGNDDGGPTILIDCGYSTRAGDAVPLAFLRLSLS